MAKQLIITEKPSVAGDIAKALGGFRKSGDVFESDTYVIASAVGHLLEIEPPDGVEVARGKWKLENLPVLPEHFDLAPIEKNAGKLATLKRLIKRRDVEGLINACDAAREGELIFRNIVRDAGTQKPIRRLWLQSMTPEGIREAFARLRSDDEMRPLADAALSRAESDWLVGINATRALTAFNSKSGGFLKTTAGRVQTPTLAILVERELKIRAFEPKPYWEVYADFGVQAGAYRGRWFDPAFQKSDDEQAKAERLWDRAKAEAVRDKCLGKPGTIEEEKKAQSQSSPLLYDLTTLQREANGRFGLSATRTLQIAQALYERHKVLTYPRTDSRYLPEDYVATAKKILPRFADPALAGFGAKAVENGWVRPNKRIFNNARISDHFAIVPTGEHAELSDMELKIFEMVARRFIAVFYPPAEYEITQRITTVEAEKFRTDGKVLIKPGWREVYGKAASADEEEGEALVAVVPGEVAATDEIEITEHVTRPPARYNESTLLSAMEGAGKLVDDEELRAAMGARGLGTPATRANIIEGLVKEGYVERRGRELVTTSKAVSLLTLLRNLQAEALTKPEMTGEWEFKLNEMEQGRISREQFMREIRALTCEIVEKVKRFGEGEITGDHFGTLQVPCPKCSAGPFREDFRTWRCAGCGLTVWKTVAGREFEPDEVKTLLTERRVGPLEGFVSKMGRRFAAPLVLNDEFKVSFDFPDADESAPPPDFSDKTPIGTCPVCKEGRVFDLGTQWGCERSTAKPRACNFRTGKEICKRPIPAEQVVKLIESGKTDLLEKFISKKGRPFKAKLVLEPGGKVGFEFAPREPKKKPAPKKQPVADA